MNINIPRKIRFLWLSRNKKKPSKGLGSFSGDPERTRLHFHFPVK